MRVFIDGFFFARQSRGGISRMWSEILRRLPSRDPDISLLIPFYHKNEGLKKIIRERTDISKMRDFFFWPARIFQRNAFRSRLLRMCYLDESVDIFQSTFFSTVYGTDVKKVVTIHDMIPEKFPDPVRGKWQRLEIIQKGEAVKNADKIIAVSQHTKKDLLALYPRVSEEKIKVIYHGPLGAVKKVPLDEIGRRHGFELLPRNFFLYVGRRTYYKNFQILISLVESRKTYRDTMFCCVGGGISDETYGEVAEKGLGRNFKFIPSVSDDELAALYGHAKALLFTSKYEGFGLPVLEAMSAGCPVICGAVSSLPEIAKDAAFYFDPCSVQSLDEAIGRFHSADRDDVVGRGKEAVSGFSWERAADELREAYSSLL